MKVKTKLKLIAVFFTGVAGIGSYFLFLPQSNQNKAVTAIFNKSFGWKYPVVKFPEVGSTRDHIAYSNIRDSGGTPQGLPVRLKIPVIGVDSAIEDALITSDGRMDVPVGSVNVAWFALGPRPGQVGSAVIGGHFGITNGVPFVFYNLNKLKGGDKIYIVDDKDDTHAFVVRSVGSFDRNADSTTVFTSNDGLAHLNLITCEGIWNEINGNFPLRLVVFTDAIPTEDPDKNIITFYRTLNVGMGGTDVAMLQTALEQKGFLIIPIGVARGFFGVLTRSAVTKYQASVGLPLVGVFGPLTRAKLISELGSNPRLPDTAIAPSVKELLTLPQILFQFLKSLYATPIVGLITLSLFILIVFMVLKIIFR